jgi:sulfoxide reductase heme-binding subunit YedZ
VIEAIPWYVTRSAGIVSLLLLTAATCLGLLTSARWQRDGWPRFLTAELHRTISLLSVVFLVIHVLVAAFDPKYGLGLAAVFLPFASSYRELWLTLGVVSLYLGGAIVITSLLRTRIGHSTWRLVHLTSYAAWPLAVLHSMGTGSDSVANWLWAIYAACIVAVAASLAWRLYVWRSVHGHLERALPAPTETGLR